jgi:medium-chain acyl-[acyl-carrier-protein] hydrolase
LKERKKETSMTRQVSKTTTAKPWFRYWLHRPHARVRLFCFPYAGGGASIFQKWSGLLPQDIEVCPIQLPGREERLAETPFFTLPSLLDTLVPLLLPYLDVPYAFFGHSMGTLISFELARMLSRIEYSLLPVHLFVSGHTAPQLPDPDPPTYHLPEQDFVEELRRLKGTPEEVLKNEELLHMLLPLLRADFALCQTYSYAHEKSLACPISAFGGLHDQDVSREALGAWREQTSGQFKMRLFQGDHFFLHKEWGSLLRALSLDLLTTLEEVGV